MKKLLLHEEMVEKVHVFLSTVVFNPAVVNNTNSFEYESRPKMREKRMLNTVVGRSWGPREAGEGDFSCE